MTYLLSKRAAFFGSFAAALLMVALFAFSVPARADDGNATSTDGAPGANAGQVIATSSDGTGGQHGAGGAIVTGDATATTSAQNNLNINDTGDADTACTAQDVDENGGCLNSSEFDATSTNEALVGNFASSTASTGANTADGGQGTTTIVTGTAFAFANILNLINTNIFNSQGLLLFLNQIFPTGLDLRDYNLDYFFDGQAGNSPTVNEDTGEPQCTLLTCPTSSAINVLSGNTATVTNSVIVRADAGGNTASTTDDGDASIDTGNAYAAANVVNLVNTNIINSSYLLASFNNFGDLDGDITLPGDDFFDKLFAHSGSAPDMNSSSYTVNNTNQLGLTGTTTSSADTGANTASTTGEGSGVVATGDAYSKSNTYTNANNNYVGGTSAFFMFRVAGEWTGDVKSLPSGLRFKRVYDAVTHDGVVSTSTLVLVTNEDTDDEGVAAGDPNGPQDPESASTANCTPPEDQHLQPGEATTTPVNNCFNSSSFLASSTNAAAVDNNIDVAANTGHNMAFTQDGDAHVVSGDAYAIANVINLINTNIVGRNWIFALFNVLGNWKGDISFGRSDLALDAKTTAATVTPGADVTYDFTITNRGDRDADDITLKADFDHNLLSFTDADGTPTDSGREWHIPTVGRGQSKTFSYTARVGSIPQGTSIPVPVAASVRSDGGSAKAQASFTLALLNVVSPPSSHGGGGGGSRNSGPKTVNKADNALPVPTSSSDEPRVTVDKTVVRISTTTPTIVDYKVVVTNAKDAGPLYGAKLSDTLFNPDSSIMYNRSWDLQDLASGDQVTLTYSVEFATSTAPGTYRNFASVTGEKFRLNSGQPMLPALGQSTVDIGTAGAVLGAATDCSLAVNQTLSYGMRGAGVIKLQSFLNAQQGSGLPVTGFFGPMTRAAVNAFQNMYAAEILAPLGLMHPTGTVAGMTQKKIRDLACTDSAAAAVSTTTPITSTSTPAL